MIDCGQDWLGKFDRLQPDAIVLTHAHPDHAWGLKNGAPCPVHAPQKTWRTLKRSDTRRLPDRLIDEPTVSTEAEITSVRTVLDEVRKRIPILSEV